MNKRINEEQLEAQVKNDMDHYEAYQKKWNDEAAKRRDGQQRPFWIAGGILMILLYGYTYGVPFFNNHIEPFIKRLFF